MAYIIPDLIKDSSIIVDNSGTTVRRTFVVADISSNLKNDPSTMWAALKSFGIPPKGKLHPTVPNVRVRGYEVKGWANDICEVIVTYWSPADFENSDTQTVDIGGALRNEVTDYSIGDKKPLWVYYDGQKDKDGKKLKQIANINVLKPTRTITFRRTLQEEFEGTLAQAIAYPTYVETLQNTILGCVNSTEWRGGAARTWLCTNVSGTASDYVSLNENETRWGLTTEISVSFEYKFETWDIWAVYKMIKDGQVPPGASKFDANGNETVDKGYKRYKYYVEVDFNTAVNLSPQR